MADIVGTDLLNTLEIFRRIPLSNPWRFTRLVFQTYQGPHDKTMA